MSFRDFQQRFRALADPTQAKNLQRFFKTGPGEYGEGDLFLGIMVPQTRRMVRESDALTEAEVVRFLHSSFHEERLLAILILVRRFEKGDMAVRRHIYKLYLEHVAQINNWDLVDVSAPNIVGEYLETDPNRLSKLRRFAASRHLWTRRIAVLATASGIRRGRSDEALVIVRILLRDPHDLIQKACGWMLREVGKRCPEKDLREFLDQYSAQMPRTMLRYAIERFPKAQRDAYLAVPIRAKHPSRKAPASGSIGES